MANCLGLYIEEHLIKYAKVSKDHNNIKVESFGIKFYDKLGEAIDQIVEETYSQKTPISINLSEEMYNYFDMFALLKNSDLEKAIGTEFESYCIEKGYNPNAFESRYAISQKKKEKDKVQVIHVSENKIELNKRIQQIKGYRLINVAPLSMAIPTLLHVDQNENCLIVNIEDKTTITTILNEQVSRVEVFEEGSGDILSKINLKENSYSKAYEICKNTTIYTSEGKSLQEESAMYLDDIMPTLYDILGYVRKVINDNVEDIEKIYLTGTAALINNIDLYFQEYLSEVNCEILRPHFVQNTNEITIKDYVEVNSAISLAMMGLGEGITSMNFKKPTLTDKIPSWARIEFNPEKPSKNKKDYTGNLKWDLGERLDKTEIHLVRVIVSLMLLIVIYSAFSGLLSGQMRKKDAEAQESIDNTNSQISLAKNDDEKIKTKINEYTTLIKNLEEANNKLTDRNKTRNMIPNLLNQIMAIVPENVQLTSIENTTDTHIVITAQSNKYEQLGYLKAKIKSDVILTNVISTAGQKDNSAVTVVIEGDIP